MTLPIRSLRLLGKTTAALDNLTGERGEIFYDLTSNSLRIFDGDTKGGQVIGESSNDAAVKDLAAGILTSATHTGVSVSYNSSQGKLSITGFSGDFNDLTNVPQFATETFVTTTVSNSVDLGNLTFTGSTVDTSDSSDIVFTPAVQFSSGITSKAITPDTDNVYDLGSPTARFRHLYVGPGTIYIGDSSRAITATETSIDLPAGTTIAGEEPLRTTIENIFNEIINNYLVYNIIPGAPTDISQLNDSSAQLVQGLVQITNVAYPAGQSFVLITGGETVTLTGIGFKSLCNVYLNGSPAASTTYVDPITVTFVTPVVSTAGTYQLTLINPDGTSADWASGIIFVTLASPKFTDPSGLLDTFVKNTSRSTTLDVIGGTAPYTFAITAGALPSGMSLNTSTGVISGTTPNLTSDTVYNFIARVTDSVAATSSSAFQIAVIVPSPWDIGLPPFTISSNRVFFIEYEEDITNTPAVVTLSAFSIVSNNVFFIEYEEDITNTPTIDLPPYSIISNNVFFTEYEEDITNAPVIELSAFGIKSYIP